jgi:transposase-like protein
MAEKFIRICPKCKSRDITLDVSTLSYNRYKCKNCGYAGVFFIEVSEKEFKRLQKTKSD